MVVRAAVLGAASPGSVEESAVVYRIAQIRRCGGSKSMTPLTPLEPKCMNQIGSYFRWESLWSILSGAPRRVLNFAEILGIFMHMRSGCGLVTAAQVEHWQLQDGGGNMIQVGRIIKDSTKNG